MRSGSHEAKAAGFGIPTLSVLVNRSPSQLSPFLQDRCDTQQPLTSEAPPHPPIKILPLIPPCHQAFHLLLALKSLPPNPKHPGGLGHPFQPRCPLCPLLPYCCQVTFGAVRPTSRSGQGACPGDRELCAAQPGRVPEGACPWARRRSAPELICMWAGIFGFYLL